VKNLRAGPLKILLAARVGEACVTAVEEPFDAWVRRGMPQLAPLGAIGGAAAAA